MDENALVENNMGLIYKQLHRLKLIKDTEAFSFGMEGLLSAIRTFDESKGTQFSTYATVCIYNNLAMYLRARSKKKVLTVVSYNEPISEDHCLMDVIPNGKTLEDAYIEKERNELLTAAFDKIYSSINNKNIRYIISLWKDSDYQATQTELAKISGVSQATVSRSLSIFKYKLRQELEANL